MYLPFGTVVLVIFLLKCSNCDDTFRYSVPEPKIEVFPKGFRVSIPDQDGVNLFAFHGNINRPMDDLEGGQFSRDVLKSEDGYWVFENKLAKLKVGDVIYYWLFVIRFNLGYRYDSGKFVVREIIPYNPTINSVTSGTSSVNTDQSNWSFEPLDTPSFKPNLHNGSEVLNPQSQNIPSIYNVQLATAMHKPISTCCQLFLNVTNQLSMLSEQIDILAEENKILSQIAQKDEHYSTTLKVFGKYPSEYYPTPKEFVQNLITEKMKLVGIKVMDAKKIPDNGVSFKVETLKDKLKIIRSESKLEGSNYELSW